MTLVRRDAPEPSDEKGAPPTGAPLPPRRGQGERAGGQDGEPASEPAELEPVEGEVVEERPPIRAWSRRLPAPVQRAVSGKTAERAAVTAVGMAKLAGRGWDGAS